MRFSWASLQVPRSACLYLFLLLSGHENGPVQSDCQNGKAPCLIYSCHINPCRLVWMPHLRKSPIWANRLGHIKKGLNRFLFFQDMFGRQKGMLRWLLGNGLAKDVCFSWKLLHRVPCHHLGEGRTTRSMLSLTQKGGADEWSPGLLQSQQQLTHFKETPLWALLCLGTTRHAPLHRSTFTEYRQLGVTHLLYFHSMYWRLVLFKKSPSYFLKKMELKS